MHAKILRDVNSFAMKNEVIIKRLKDEKMASYIDSLFKGDFMKNMYTQFEHLSYARMANAVEMRE